MILLASCCYAYAGAKYYNLYILTGKYGIGAWWGRRIEKRKKKKEALEGLGKWMDFLDTWLCCIEEVKALGLMI